MSNTTDAILTPVTCEYEHRYLNMYKELVVMNSDKLYSEFSRMPAAQDSDGKKNGKVKLPYRHRE